MGSFARIGTAALGAIVVVLTAAQPWGQGSGAATTKARAVRMDFDGDGRTDFVTVSASGKYLQWTMKLSSEGLRLLRFGDNATDEPVPGDFDGDGATDAAVWRPSADGTARWLIASGDHARTIRFGLATDRPIVGDFDGDGKDDPSIVRVTDGRLVLWSLGRRQSTRLIGKVQDTPIVGDFDGDGTDDIAILRVRRDGSWERHYVSSAEPSVDVVDGFGRSESDLVMPSCDVDGDGHDDFVVFRGGGRAIRPSAPWFVAPNASPAALWGIGGSKQDRAVPGDYDGDGRCDFAVFRPSEGRWYVRFSDDDETTTAVVLDGFLPASTIGVA